ncbi:unnamed protein product [Polarella glacialis]|uniref:Uncharacterized protein n=1 Tax=Polarella glacialis TaxID=89957 RepID=A0A813G6I4_POLGL|nr:unnamed protein product [Polarella glacialis]CAE8705241.1 unnamed protein product [Polarella glacialis]
MSEHDATSDRKSRTASWELLGRAGALLTGREEKDARERIQSDSRRTHVAEVLVCCLEVAEVDESEDVMQELERALEAAQKVGVFPELRVKARRVITQFRQSLRRVTGAEANVQRLQRRLEAELLAAEETSRNRNRSAPAAAAPALSGEGEGSSTCKSSLSFASPAESASSNGEFKRQKKIESLMQQLQVALKEAEQAGVPEESCIEAVELSLRLEQHQRADQLTAKKLHELAAMEDPEKIEDFLFHTKDGSMLPKGGEARRMLDVLTTRVVRLAEKEQLQQWLLSELSQAGEASDLLRLKQLFVQADVLKLTVPPAVVALLHELESEEAEIVAKGDTFSSTTSSTKSSCKDPHERQRVFGLRRIRMVKGAVEEAEDDPHEECLDAARKAICEGQQTGAPAGELEKLEKRLTALELEHRPRQQAERQLLGVMLQAEAGPGHDPEETLLLEEQVKELREAIAEATRRCVDEEMIQAAEEMLERTIEARNKQRAAMDEVRRALFRPGRTEADVERLEKAVDDARSCNCGVQAAHALRKLAHLREVQVNRETAGAELVEASKGLGYGARERLENAVREAKRVGVSAEKLRASAARLAELAEHERRCALIAGNIRRILPVLRKEPWRFQHYAEAAKSMSPWSQELEQCVGQGQELLVKIQEEQKKLKEAQHVLQSTIKRIEEARSKGELTGELLAALPAALEKGKGAGVSEELLREGQQHMKDFKREGCQRSVAEHRLKLALNARDHAEIERSMRQVRALGIFDIKSLGGGGAQSARGDRAEPSKSARLMEVASSTLRHLSDAAARRQVAAASLQQCISEGGSDSIALPPVERSMMGGSADAAATQKGIHGWLKEAQDALQEAKHCGVAPTLIEQAKHKIRLKRRECQEQLEANKALQKVLSKKDAPQQVVLAKMRRVQRLQADRSL